MQTQEKINESGISTIFIFLLNIIFGGIIYCLYLKVHEKSKFK